MQDNTTNAVRGKSEECGRRLSDKTCSIKAARKTSEDKIRKGRW